MTGTRPITPPEIERAGRARWGADWKRPMAAALGVHPDTVAKWAAGKRVPGPGLRAEMALIVRGGRPDAERVLSRLRSEAAELAANLPAHDEIADALESTVGLLHGLTRRELALLGWLAGPGDLDDLEAIPTRPGSERWLRAWSSPAKALWRWALGALADEVAGGRAALADGEAERLDYALARLTDTQALEVAAAARDVDDLTTGVPDD